MDNMACPHPNIYAIGMPKQITLFISLYLKDAYINQLLHAQI